MVDNSFILLSKFEEITSTIPRDNFHLNASIDFVEHQMYVTDWCIYRKFLPVSAYLTSNEPPILAKSAGNTMNDLIEFAKQHNKADC
ncbi:MAG: hypothetical protein Q4D02_04380 [Clostridia bacterium]|nr:hypothetical protein [Clostridia bacterium]